MKKKIAGFFEENKFLWEKSLIFRKNATQNTASSSLATVFFIRRFHWAIKMESSNYDIEDVLRLKSVSSTRLK